MLGHLTVLCTHVTTGVVQATWLTGVAHGIRRLGQEISARPFVYSETPELELNMFLNFSEATGYKVRTLQH